MDQFWYEFRRQLEYKSVRLEGCLQAVPLQNTSRTCPCCGNFFKENRLTQANFDCIECGYKGNVDIIGAINILARGREICV